MRLRSNAIRTDVSFIVESTESDLVRGQGVDLVVVRSNRVHRNRFHTQRVQRLFIVGEGKFCVFYPLLDTLRRV